PKGADGKPVKYSIPEIMDILNDALHKQNWMLLRTHNCLCPWPAPDKIPDEMIPQILRKDLDDWGKTEWVNLFVPVRNGKVANVANAIMKILGPNGKAVALPNIKHIWLQGRGGLVKEALQVLDEFEQAKTLTYKCKWIRATIAKEQLNVLWPQKN